MRRFDSIRIELTRGEYEAGRFTKPEALSASGIGLTSVLFLLRAVNPRILALTRCRTGRVTESVFINGPLGSGGRSALRSEDLTRAPTFCALKYRLIAPGFWRRFCKISCVYPPRCFCPANVIGPPNISRISNSPLPFSPLSLSLSLSSFFYHLG